jgi:hypothetical protein
MSDPLTYATSIQRRRVKSETPGSHFTLHSSPFTLLSPYFKIASIDACDTGWYVGRAIW